MQTSGIFPVLSTGTCATFSIHSWIALVMCGTTIRQNIVYNKQCLCLIITSKQIKQDFVLHDLEYDSLLGFNQTFEKSHDHQFTQQPYENQIA